MYPPKIISILEKFYKIQELSPSQRLSMADRKCMVDELIKTYKSLSFNERIDLLIPERADFLADIVLTSQKAGHTRIYYNINYKWPDNDGFATKHFYSLLIGKKYDRIGPPSGRFLCPYHKKAQSYLSRALPYYIEEDDLEKCPLYHKYIATKNYHRQLSGIKKVYIGIISQCFHTNPKDGGGTQVLTPNPISDLLDNGYLRIISS